MKKRPNKRPRYGAISDSTCKENSVSARSKPARNAPNAMESPACSTRRLKEKEGSKVLSLLQEKKKIKKKNVQISYPSS